MVFVWFLVKTADVLKINACICSTIGILTVQGEVVNSPVAVTKVLQVEMRKTARIESKRKEVDCKAEMPVCPLFDSLTEWSGKRRCGDEKNSKATLFLISMSNRY